MYIIPKLLADRTICSIAKRVCSQTPIRILLLLAGLMGTMAVNADNYFEFTSAEEPLDDVEEPDGYSYTCYPLDELGNPIVSACDVNQFFGYEESRIIARLTLTGKYSGDQRGSKVSKLARIYNQDETLPELPHLLGNLPSNSKKRSGKLEIVLRPNPDRTDGLWDISRIELDAAPVSDIGAPSLIISGEEVMLPAPKGLYRITRNFNSEEGLTDRFTIEVETGRPMAFGRIRVLLRELEAYPADWEFSGNTDQHHLSQYEIPGPAIGGMALTEKSRCHVYNLKDMAQVSTGSVYETEYGVFTVKVPGFGKFGIAYELNESVYGLPIKYAVPSLDRLLPFTIKSDFVSTYTINDAPFMDGVTYVHRQAPITQGHDWTNAVIGNIPEGVVLYWRVEQDETFTIESVEAREIRRGTTRKAGSEDIPEGFTKYDPAIGIDLTQGNRLHLISEQNGNRSDIFSTYYTPYTGPTNVALLPGNDSKDICQAIEEGHTEGIIFYTLQGVRASYDDIRPGTVMIAVGPSGAAVKVVKH